MADNITKIINASLVRKLCQKNGMKVSKYAIEELAIQTEGLLQKASRDAFECGNRVILRRHIEARYFWEVGGKKNGKAK